MKLPKFKLKMIAPFGIAVIFISSIFVVFSSGGLQTQKATLIVDFSQPDMLFRQDSALGPNTTAVKLLSIYSPSLELKNKQMYCIIDYCNTNVTKWYFYVVADSGLGPQEVDPGISPDDYIVKNGDIVIFRYQIIRNSTI